MSKIYLYKNKVYCDDNIAHIDNRYAGDLDSMYWEMKYDGKAKESTIFYNAEDGELSYSTRRGLIENEFCDLCIGESKVMIKDQEEELNANRVITDDEISEMGPEIAEEIALRSIANEFADRIKPLLDVKVTKDPDKGQRIIYGNAKFIKPWKPKE